MNKHILVTYATKAGSTAEVARTIALRLEQRGFMVDLKNIEQKPNLEGYDFIVIGSAVRMGKWLPQAVDFIKNNTAYFSKIPHALFTVHLLNVEEDEVSRTNRLAYLDSIRPWVKPLAEAFFAGSMDFSRLSVLDKFVAKMVKAVEEDRRDWVTIQNWADTLVD